MTGYFKAQHSTADISSYLEDQIASSQHFWNQEERTELLKHK